MIALEKHTAEGWVKACEGALVSEDSVLTAAGCVDDELNDTEWRVVLGDYTSAVYKEGDSPDIANFTHDKSGSQNMTGWHENTTNVTRDMNASHGDNNPANSSQHNWSHTGCAPAQILSVVKILKHPSYRMDGRFDVAVLVLGGSAMRAPVGLHGGGELVSGLQEAGGVCAGQATLVRVGSGEVSMMEAEQCVDIFFMEDGYFSVASGREVLCARGESASTLCEDLGGGTPLISTVSNSNLPGSLIAIQQTRSCVPGGANARVYTRISEIQQWVLAAIGKAHVPAQRLALDFSGISLGNASVAVCAGVSEDQKALVASFQDSAPRFVYDTAGAGSLLVVLNILPSEQYGQPCDHLCFAHRGFTGKLSVLDCAQNFKIAGGAGLSACEKRGSDPAEGSGGGMEGCLFRPSVGLGLPEGCVETNPCSLGQEVTWDLVMEWQGRG